MKCKIVENAGAYEIFTPYEGGFVRELKALVPASERCYNADRKTWTVAEKYGRQIAELCCRYFGTRPILPVITSGAETTGILTVLYIGRVKDRGNGERSAFGWMQLPDQLFGGWNAVFPEKALRGYFDPSFALDRAAPTGTYYETLGIIRGASDAEIKAGYRRMVKQWHPDVCKDPDAHEVFIRIQTAFEALSDPKKRARYDAGLRFQDGMPVQKQPDLPESEYRSPLKCGNILCRFSRIGARCVVSSILSWQDIVDKSGRILVTSWEKDAQEPTMIWN